MSQAFTRDKDLAQCIERIPSNLSSEEKKRMLCYCAESDVVPTDPSKASKEVQKLCRTKLENTQKGRKRFDEERKGAVDDKEEAEPSDRKKKGLPVPPEEQVLVRTSLRALVRMQDEGLPVEIVQDDAKTCPKTAMTYDPVRKEYDIRSHPDIDHWGVKVAGLAGYVPDHVAQNMPKGMQGADKHRCKRIDDFSIESHPSISLYVSKKEHDTIKKALEECDGAFGGKGRLFGCDRKVFPQTSQRFRLGTENAADNEPSDRDKGREPRTEPQLSSSKRVSSLTPTPASQRGFLAPATARKGSDFRQEGFANPPRFPCKNRNYCIEDHRDRDAFVQHVLDTQCQKVALTDRLPSKIQEGFLQGSGLSEALPNSPYCSLGSMRPNWRPVERKSCEPTGLRCTWMDAV